MPKVNVFHVVDVFGSTERHLRAQDTWLPLYNAGELKQFRVAQYPRNAKQAINDPRELPFMKDLFAACINQAGQEDILLWTNDDITLAPSIGEWVRGYVGRHDATSMRRIEPKMDYVHIGRDMMAFKVSWLRKWWDEIPDYILGASDFDLGMAAFIRHKHGIKTHMGNMGVDLPPADAVARLIAHEPHKGAWEHPDLTQIPSTRWNRKAFMGWAFKHQQSMKFTGDGLLQ